MKSRFLLFLSLMTLSSVPAQALEGEALKFFEMKVRPVLAENCMECHGTDTQKADLRLDHLEFMLQGGESGAVIVPGKPTESLMVEAIHWENPDFQMPPSSKGQLSEQQIADLEQWVAMGAPWPTTEPVPEGGLVDEHGFTAKEREWWAIQPVIEPEVPETGQDWARNAIDRFVAAGLEEADLQPAREADRKELVRRAFMDLHGLPPTPEEVAEFVTDERPDAWQRLIDRLLESPRYGERWAQHWLDVVRWAESDGYRQDAFRPQAWPYRDYVIRSFNEDKPYDQFVREQLAGDEIDRDNPDVLIGTAFLRNGIYEYNQRNARMHWELIVDEMTGLTGEVFLGLGIGCAQCHDHKFDPMLQEDYYRLKAFLAPVRWRHDLPLAKPEEIAEHDAQLAVWEEATADIRKEIDAMVEPKIEAKMRSAISKFPEDIKAMEAKAPVDRTPYEQQLVELAEVQARYERYRFDENKTFKGEELEKLQALRKDLKEFDHLKPQELTEAFVATDIGPEAPKVLLHKRNGAEEIQPGFISILEPEEAEIPPSKHEDGTGRRLALANWIARDDNPLSTRVFSNRIWQHHFGTGIVPTPNDFGTLGEAPSHPELLDWLTLRLVENDWRIKDLHRVIMNSATYRQTAFREPTSVESITDPGNRLLWRFPPRRLDAEQVRDSMLAMSGELDLKEGGPSVSGTSPRRSVYVKKIRNTPDAMLKGFDAPLGFGSEPQRVSTTTATQSLLMINGDWPNDRAHRMANELLKLHGKVGEPLVREAWMRVYGREPQASEMQAALEFMDVQQKLANEEKPVELAEDRYPGETGLRPIEQVFGHPNLEDLGIGERALWLQPGSRFERLLLTEPPLESDVFTIEAVANLDSLYKNASVRTLASRWNGSHVEGGWTFGVTSEKSGYDPRNFIVQLTGQNQEGDVVYEVVASDLRFPLNRPTYIAAVISAAPTEPGGDKGTVTFYMRDLTDPEAVTEKRVVEHPIVAGIQNPDLRVITGGREASSSHMWDGQLARLAITNRGLEESELLIAGSAKPTDRLIDWKFAAVDGEAPADGALWLREREKSSALQKVPDATLEAVSDLCHMLFNSNEFLYLH